ncbi:hypothetical protein C8B47_02200, partial [filamentous cyanobacterium CCP4]
MSTLTILCFDAPAPLLDRLTTEFSNCRVRQAATAPAAWVGPLLANGDEVAIAIAPAAWLNTGELEVVYDHFPRALTVVLDDSSGASPPAAAPQTAIYRHLPYPGTDDELVFTVTAALGYYRQGQQLALAQTALAEAHHQLAAVERRMSALAVQLDWGVSSLGDRARMERALRQSQGSLTEAQRIAQMGSWEFDLASQRITWSAEMFRIYGLDPTQPAPTFDQWRQTIPPADWPPLQAAIERAIATGAADEAEHRIVRPDGAIRYLLSREEAVYNDQGQVVQLRGTAQDRTAARLAEIALEQSEARFRQLAETVREGFFVFDAVAQRYEYVNPAYFAITGVTPEALKDREHWLTRVHPDDRDRITALAARELQGNPVDCEYRFLRPDGELRWLRSQGYPIVDDQGAVVRIVGTVDDVTALKQAELDLKQLNEELERRVRQRTQERQTLAAVVENSTDLIGTASLSGAAIYLNRAGRDLLGLGDAPLNGRSISSFHTAETVAQLEQTALPTVMATGRWRGEATFCHDQSGETIAVEQVIFLVQDPETHGPLCIATICRDIRDRKRSETVHRQAELAIQSSEERFRATFEQAAVGMVQADLEGRFVKVNQTFCELVGYSAAELDGKPYASITHPADLQEESANVERLLAGTATSFTMEKRYLHRDRTVVWVNLAVTLVRDGVDQPQYFIGVINNITQRKQAQRDLSESRNMLRLVLDTIPQRVFWKDRESRFLGCNPAFAGDYRLTPEQVIGRTDLDLPWAAYGDRYRADDAAIMASKTPKLGYEEQTYNASGECIWIRTSKIPLTNTQGDVIGVLGCYEDITASKQAEASLVQLNQALEQRVQERTWELEQAVAISEAASQAKSTFLANMSHELRTPLNAILGFAQLMARDRTLSDAHQRSLGIVNRSGEHLLMLINDILEMAKIEARQVNLKVASFDLDALLNTLNDMFALRAEDKGLTLTIDRHPALPRHFELDVAKLRQVLINLLGNAVKFTHQGQVTLWVEPTDALAAPPFPGTVLRVTFTVSDTGIGLATACLLYTS